MALNLFSLLTYTLFTQALVSEPGCAGSVSMVRVNAGQAMPAGQAHRVNV